MQLLSLAGASYEINDFVSAECGDKNALEITCLIVTLIHYS